VFGAPIEGELLTTGTPLGSPPLIDLISNDPILRGVKVFQLNSLQSIVYLCLSSICGDTLYPNSVLSKLTFEVYQSKI